MDYDHANMTDDSAHPILCKINNPNYTLDQLRALTDVGTRCICRNCGKEYLEEKATADFTGYCTQGCLRAKAKELGFKPGGNLTIYRVLKINHQIGSVPWTRASARAPRPAPQ